MPHCNKHKISFVLQFLWIADQIIEVVKDEKELAGEALDIVQKE
jgi:hypothetical protein